VLFKGEKAIALFQNSDMKVRNAMEIRWFRYGEKRSVGAGGKSLRRPPYVSLIGH
jgi:hypothetical protein